MGLKPILSIIERTAKYTKACGKNSILQTKSPVFHGSNQLLTNPKNGKTFALPRFISEEMNEARKMNKIATKQLKNPVSFEFPNANAKDLERLTSTSSKAADSRAIFTNPKDGAVYHLLEEGRTENGLVNIRILDSQGGFIKNATIKPKKIIIIDDFSSPAHQKIGETSSMLEYKTHGDIVSILTKRANPFADIELIDMYDKNNAKAIQNFYAKFADLQKRIDKGEKIDFVSLSLGQPISKKDIGEICKDIGITPMDIKNPKVSFIHPNIKNYEASLFATKNKNTTRVIQGAGNYGKDGVSIWTAYPNIEGVGALNPTNAKIANFSSGRNSFYTQHYEQGIFPYQSMKEGLSLTGGRSVDIPLKENVKALAKQYVGQTPIITTAEENKTLFILKKSAQSKYLEKTQKLRPQLSTPAEKSKLNQLNREMEIAKNNRDKEKFMALRKEAMEISSAIDKRVQTQMKDFNCEEAETYKKLVQQMKQENKVQGTGFAREYAIPSEDPFTNTKEIAFELNKDGKLELQTPRTDLSSLSGTSFATPVRTAKLALNDMMRGIV